MTYLFLTWLQQAWKLYKKLGKHFTKPADYSTRATVSSFSTHIHNFTPGQKLLQSCFFIKLIYILGGNAIPAWAISLIAGIGMLLIGGILYVVMRKLVLSSETGTMNTYQPALQNEEV